MKKNLLLPALLLMIGVVVMVGCKALQPTANFVEIKYTGCNGQKDVAESHMTDEEQPDGMTYSFIGDSLMLEANINYICCAEFEATQKVEGDKITLMITETTESPDQYCRCMCLYTFEFYYNNLEHDSYAVEVVFDSLDDSKDKTFTTEIRKPNGGYLRIYDNAKDK